MNIVANLGSMVFAGLGGALVPLWLLPEWVQRVAPASPAYCAMRGFRSVVLERGGFAEVLLPLAALGAWSLAPTAVALARFRFAHRKVPWA